MTITLEINGDTAVFRYPSGYDHVVDEFDDLLDRRSSNLELHSSDEERTDPASRVSGLCQIDGADK